MLRKIRIILASVFFIGVTLLFLDFTGTIHAWLGWMAKVQFLPAVLAMNFGVVAVLLVLTLLFGRVYCSVICPLGVMQDIISWIHGKTKKKNRFRFSYSPAKNVLRYVVLAVFILAALLGFHSFVALIAPYSAYGRIASNLLAPVYQWGNNFFAWIAERTDSYAFYSTEVWIKSGATFGVAAITLVVVGVLAWKHGRTWCNTICPVGSVLGFLSRFSVFAPVIDTDKCRNCGLCGKQCKASCINMKEHKIDLMLGSSLGAFLVMNCPGVLRIAINPCWSPSVELPKIDYDGPVDGYIQCEGRLGAESASGDADLCIGCFADEDEIFGMKYRPAFEQFFKTTYDIPGGHHLSEEGARKIITEIAPRYL